MPLGNYVQKVTGKALSTNDFTDAIKADVTSKGELQLNAMTVYRHPLGDAEYVGNNDFTGGKGFGFVHEAATVDRKFNRLTLNAGRVNVTGPVYIKLYHFTGTTSPQIPDTDWTQLSSEVVQVWNTSINALRTITFSETLTLPANRKLLVAIATKDGVQIYIRTWNVVGTPARQLFYFVSPSSNYDAIFSASWIRASAPFYSLPISLYLDLKPKPRLTIPAEIVSVVGIESSLQYDAMVIPQDSGLNSPLNWTVEVVCTKGKSWERNWLYTPVVGDIGTTTMTINVYDDTKAISETKTVSLVTIAATGLGSAKNILRVGDSLEEFATSATTLRSNFVAIGGTTPTFRGHIGDDPVKRQGIGGWTFSYYATAGPTFYKMSVTGITTVGVFYSNNGSEFRVREVNVTSGSGYIKIEKLTGTNAPTTNGTLTRTSGSGDATIAYTGSITESGNPFWNPSTSLLDIAYYRNNLGMGATKFDLVVIQLGVNESFGTIATPATRNAILAHAKRLTAAFLADNSPTKIVIELPTLCGDTRGGWAYNYGANYNRENYILNIWALKELLLNAFDAALYHANVFVGPAGLAVDRYFGYGRTSRIVGSRYSDTEMSHDNAVHPITVGYQQMADAITGQCLRLLT